MTGWEIATVIYAVFVCVYFVLVYIEFVKRR